MRSNTNGYGIKSHKTDSQNSETTAPRGSCSIWSSRSRRPVRKLLDTPPKISACRHDIDI